jgi:hypothetical protein
VAFAYLEETARISGHNLDLISALVPLLGVISANHDGEPFQAKLLATELRERFALRVNPYAVEQWIPKLKAAGLIKSIELSRQRGNKQVEQLTFTKPAGNVSMLDESDVQKLVDAFLRYALPKLEKVENKISSSVLEDFFLKEIADLDFLASVFRTSKQIARNKITLRGKEDPSLTEYENLEEIADLEVLCASFFIYMAENEPATFEQIVKIASGAVISEVLFDVGNPQTNISFNGQKIILDGPICIKALGLNSREDEAHTLELLRSLADRGAILSVYDHTISEVELLLAAALKGSNEPWGYGPTVRRIRQDKTIAIVAQAILGDVVSELQRIGVNNIIIRPTSSNSWSLLPQAREDSLAEGLGWYENAESRARDAASLANTYRLRGGVRTQSKNLHQASHLFITENPRLVDAAYKFFSDEADAPIVVTDRYLAGYLFVMCGGSDDITSLLKKKVLANCTNAVAPRTDLIQKMAGFVEKLDVEQREKYSGMMTHSRAGRYLTEVTFGNVSYLSDDNYEEILEEIFQEAIVERTRVLDQQKKVLQEEHNEKLLEMQIEANKKIIEKDNINKKELELIGKQLDRLVAEQEEKEKVKFAFDQIKSDQFSAIAVLANEVHLSSKYIGYFLYLIYILLAFIITWVGDFVSPDSEFRYIYYVCNAVLVFLALHQMPVVLIDKPKRKFANYRYRKLVGQRGLVSVAKSFHFDTSSGELKKLDNI